MAVYTAPLAIIKVGGKVIGKMKNIRISETIRRARVTGLGRLNASEIPAVEFTGTLNCSFYSVKMSENFGHELNADVGVAQNTDTALIINTTTVPSFVNTVVLHNTSLTIVLLKKVFGSLATTGVVTPGTDETFATITNAFITGDNFDVNEGQISGHDSTFEYLDPMVFQA